MLWSEPNLLWLFAGIVALALALVWASRRGRADLSAFAEASLLGRLESGLDRRRRTIRLGLRLAALAFLVFALAGPKWGFHWQEVKREGIDLIVAIDTSRSMLATDVKPNRLERAKLAVLDLVGRLEGDRVGLVAFAGTAFLECPLTLDYAAFETSLRAVDVGLIPRGGTSLERAIETSLEAFEARQGKHEALILITDGEDHEGDAAAAAAAAAEHGVKIFAVGIGTAQGELIPLGGGREGYVKDRSGQVVKSRLDEKTLEEVALATSGAYVRGLGPDLGLDQVFRDHIARMERREVASSLERRYEPRFQLPLAVALLLLVAEILVAERRPAARRSARAWFRRPLRRGRARGRRAEASVLLLALLPFLVGWLDPPGDRAAEGNRLFEAGKFEEAAAKYGEGLVDAPESNLLQFNRAAALYRQGEYADAITALNKVASAGEEAWVALASYNLGNAYYRLGANAEESDPEAAIASYEQALAAYRRAMSADPADSDPKYNHEFVERKLADLRERLERERQEQQQQQQDEQEPQPEEQEQPQDQDGQEQGEEQEPPQQEQPGGDQPQPDDEGGEQPEQQAPPEEQAAAPEPETGEQAGGGETVPSEEERADEQAAQAVLDTARDEELGPEEVRRPVGVAGVGEPVRDW